MYYLIPTQIEIMSNVCDIEYCWDAFSVKNVSS